MTKNFGVGLGIPRIDPTTPRPFTPFRVTFGNIFEAKLLLMEESNKLVSNLFPFPFALVLQLTVAGVSVAALLGKIWGKEGKQDGQ